MGNSILHERHSFGGFSENGTALLSLLGISVVLHLIYMIQLQASPYASVLMVDAEGYHLKALKILKDGWLGDSAFYQAPFYPYFLAILYKLFGQETLVPKWIQAGLSVANIWLAYQIGKRLFGSKTGIVSATLFTFTGVNLHFSGLLLKVSLSMFFSFLLLDTLLRASMEQGFGKWLGGGIFLGVNIALRGNFLIMIPAIALWVLFCLKDKSLKARVRRVVVFILGATLIIFPITLRNYYVSGEWILTTYQAGANFYQGNNPKASGMMTSIDFVRLNPEFEERDFRNRAEQLSGKRMSPSQISKFWLKRSLDFILEEPRAFMKLFGKKILLLLNNYEIPDNYDFTFMREQVPILRVGFVSFGFILICGACGFVFCHERGPRFWLLVNYLSFYAFSVVLFFVNSRYRLPILTGLYPIAGWFLVEGWRRFFELKVLRKFLFICGLLVMLWAVFRPFSISNPSFSHWKLGVAFQRTGEIERSEKQFIKASVLDPENDRPHLHLGLIYLEQGKEKKALMEFEEAIKRNPNSEEALFRAATIYFINQNIEQAELTYLRALALNPNVPQARFNLSMIYYQRGLLNRAFFELRTVLRLNPKYSEAHFNLAGIYLLKKKLNMAYYHYSLAKNLGYPVDPKIFQKIERLRNLFSAPVSAG